MALEKKDMQEFNIEKEQLTLKEIINKINEWTYFIKSKWQIILIAIVLGALIGLIFAFYEKPTYKATLTFAMEDEKGGGGIGGALGLASSFGIDLGGVGGGGAFAASNLAELMKSRLIVEKVLLKPIKIEGKSTSLAEYYIKINELRDSWDKIMSLKGITFLPNSETLKFTLQQDSILQIIHKNLINENNLNIFQKDKKVTIITIEVNSQNELFSKIFCQNLAKETSDFYIETKSKKSRINVDVLQKQVDSIRNELNLSITGVASEIDNIYNLNPAFNVKGAPSKKRQIDLQANTAILTNLVIQLELAKITLRKETPLIQLIDEPRFPLSKNKFGKKKSLIVGGLISGLLSVIFLLFIEIYKKLKD